MYKLRNFVNSVKKNFDPDGYMGGEGLFSLIIGGTGSSVAILSDYLQKSRPALSNSAGLYAASIIGTIVTAASVVLFIDDTLFNSKLLGYILQKI